MSIKADFSEIDLCVKCGLCLPYCPTYTLSKNENKSPRGRLALIQAWSEGHLELSNTLSQHIDSCLTCRACENMCPAQVPYAHLINQFRAETAEITEQPLSTAEQFTVKLLTGQHSRGVNALLRFYQQSGLNELFGKYKENDYLPDTIINNQLNDHYPHKTAIKQGNVALFTGCVSKTVDAKTLIDAITVLQHCGFAVSLPKNQCCCGAIDKHAGQQQRADELALQNKQAFSTETFDAVITVASGCGSTLAEYSNALATNIIDINDFIAPFLSALSFKPLPASAWLHTPCTLKNVSYPHSSCSKGAQVPKALAAINGLKVYSFSENQLCCGAAGTYMLSQPETANTLLDQALAPLHQQPTDFLLTSNIGCAMHLRAGLKQAGLNTQVLHPISLLAQQLETP